MRTLLFLALFALVARAQETYPPFRSDLPAGSAFRLDARQLHPTQFTHGWREVVHKAALINAMSPAELTGYLKDKDVPVVIGPGGIPYLTDGHHTLRALIESNATDKTCYGHIIVNWSALDAASFWARMVASNYTYLKDAAGRDRPAATLPTSLQTMERDPWRSLAWGVMAAGGFAERKDVLFQEFRWAEYFRDKVRWDDADDGAFAKAVTAACILARDPAAAALPGYRTTTIPAAK